MAEAPRNPFRVTREFDGPPLTKSQQRVLASLVSLCPDSGSDADARAIATQAGARLGSVVLVLRSLVERRMAIFHPAEHEGEVDAWTPTMTGRSRVRHFPAARGDRHVEPKPTPTD